jgi:REP element-mobilizing transposase RayT
MGRSGEAAWVGYPRAYTVDAQAPGFYHCVSRCVRRAWLCGEDPVSGRNFDHRRDWVEARLIDLAESFAVGLYAWAVMGNHTHVVLRIDPGQVWSWSAVQVAQRWARLARTLGPEPDERVEARIQALLEQPKRLAEVRLRLGSLSWFMRYLNECIARQANAEDGCGGRFWEGRFRCQALLDDQAVLACMTYVDLNPIRAGLAEDLGSSDFTTIQRRLRQLERDPDVADTALEPMAGEGVAAGISLRAYVELVDWSGRIARSDKRGVIEATIPAALERIRGSPDWWRACVLRIEAVFRTAVGTPGSLRARAAASRRRCLVGVSIA